MVEVDGPRQQPAEVREHYEQSKDSLIMMVDDEPIVMGVVQAYLEEKGYTQFITCEDSREALDIIRDRKPDVILLDLMMPNVTGFDILYELSADASIQRIPVIVLTTASDSPSKLRALEMGATDFLAKPVDASELALRLRNTLTVKAYQDQLERFDQLTGLPNRGQFQERMQWAYRQSLLHQRKIYVIHIGLDRFRMINNTMGSKIGDEILVQVAHRLNDVVHDAGLRDGFVARLAGDEFALIFADSDGQSPADVMRQLLNEIHAPMFIEGREVVASASCGAVSTSDVSTPDELILKASIALKHAKLTGVNKTALYSTEMDAEADELMALETDLRHAIANDELELFYQAKMTAKDRKVYGFEALLRWRTSDGGMISPGKFIPVAENAGLIVPIGRWILKQACSQARELELAGVPITMSVNVSAHQLIEPDIVISIREALEASKLSPHRLVIEITESVMMGDVERSLRILHEIKSLGCSLSVDDFGTGYSSLSYLKRFPIEELKIDQSFLTGLPDDPEDTAIVKAIIALATSLELSVTAEGVETVAQADYLEANGCNLLQGYHFSRPIPFDEVPAFCQTQHLFES